MFINWPDKKPNVEPKMIGAFNDENRKELTRLLKDIDFPFVVELGTYYGMSTKFFAENAHYIYTVDTFKGSREHNEREDLRPLIPGMFDTFLVNLWDYKDKVWIYPESTANFFVNAIHIDTEFVDLVYIDASHEFVDVYRDVEMSYLKFHNAKICGDDFKWPSVKAALDLFCDRYDKRVEYVGNFWEIV